LAPAILLLGGEAVEAGRDAVALVASTGESVAGAVRGADGTAVGGARVAVRQGRTIMRHALTGPDGRFAAAGLLPGACDLGVTAEGFAGRSLADVVAGTTDLDIVLVPLPVARARIVRPDGSALAYADVRLLGPTDDDVRIARTDGVGRLAVTFGDRDPRVVEVHLGGGRWVGCGEIRPGDPAGELTVR
jgi:hypothetical protein